MNKTHFVAYVTGGLRSGKGLFAIKTIQEFAVANRRIVTNYDLYLENLLPHSKKNIDITRLPDRPTVKDLEFIGEGYTSDNPLDYDESKFGLIALDELGAWMNCRAWNEKGRKEVIDWLLHSGKRRWCLLLTIQDLEMLDSQFRNATASQLVVRCVRLGNVPLPFITSIVKFITGYRITLPDMRLAVVRAGEGGVVTDKKLYKGTQYFHAYNTRQEFYTRDDPRCLGMSSYLSPWHLKGRYKVKKDWVWFKSMLRINPHWLLYPSAVGLFIGFAALGASFFSVRSVVALEVKSVPTVSPSLPVIPTVDCTEFNKMFTGYMVTGHFYNSQSNATSYVFANAKETYLSSRLINAGYEVTAHTDCSAFVVKNGCVVDLKCQIPYVPQQPVSAPSAGIASSVVNSVIKP